MTLSQGDATVDLPADAYGDPGLPDRFVQLLSGALAHFVRAVRDPGDALQGVRDLYDLCRAACPPPRTRFDVEIAAVLVRLTATLLDQLGIAPPTIVRPVPDGDPDSVPPPTLAIDKPANFEITVQRMGFEVSKPSPPGALAWGQPVEAANAADRGAMIIPFRVPVPIPFETSGDLRERIAREPINLGLHDVASLLKSSAMRLETALASLPKNATVSRAEQKTFVTWTSAYIRQRTGRWLDQATAALYEITYGKRITVDKVRMIRTRALGRVTR